MPELLKLELPDESVLAMREAAQRSGRTLEEWALLQLRRCAPTEEEQEKSLTQLLQHTVNVPEAVGADEALIEQDVAREYAGDHG